MLFFQFVLLCDRNISKYTGSLPHCSSCNEHDTLFCQYGRSICFNRFYGVSDIIDFFAWVVRRIQITKGSYLRWYFTRWMISWKKKQNNIGINFNGIYLQGVFGHTIQSYGTPGLSFMLTAEVILAQVLLWLYNENYNLWVNVVFEA